MRRGLVTRSVLAIVLVRVAFACSGYESEDTPGTADAGTDGSNVPDVVTTPPVDTGATIDSAITLGPYPGDPGSLAEYVQAGSRLVPRWETTSVGVRRFLGWRDTMLAIDCTFAADGFSYRCFPDGPSGSPTGLFATSACSASAKAALSSCTDGPYIRETTSGCPSTIQIFERGAENDGKYFVVGGSGQCLATTTSAPSKSYLYGPAVDSYIFVEGTLVPIPNDGGVPTATAHQMVAADGSRQFWSLRADGADCTIQPRVSGLRCIPTYAPSYYGDSFHPTSACTGAKPLAHGIACEGVKHARNYSGQCGIDDTYRTLESLAQGAFIPFNGGPCTQVASSPQVWIVGTTEIPNTVFPLAQVLPLLPDVRLQPRRYVLPDGRHGERQGLYYDQQLASDCSFGLAADGSRRCLPESVGASDYFEDATCTKPIRLSAWDPLCQPATPKFAYEFVSTGCGAKRRFFSLGPVRAGAVYYRSNETCYPAATQPYAPVGAEVPPEAFVEITVRDGGT